ncbi:MAG: hypothetical protein WCJ69_06805 [Betaproteobacteria bacterium]
MRPRLATALLGMSVLAGCQLRPPVEMDVPARDNPPTPAAAAAPCPPPVAHASTRGNAEELLERYADVRNRPAAALRQDLDEARREFTTTGSDASRLRLALLYLHPGAPFHSETAAAQVLEPLVRPDARGRQSLRGLAQVLMAQVEQARRADSAALNQATRLRDEQRRTEELQRKLDALKEVERAMIQKDQGGRAR